MIKPGEIQQKAGAAGVRDQQIEKDYVLSWILDGISLHPGLSQSLVFKGGTLLKKVYFKEYRYSEDLDFTLILQEHPNPQLLTWFDEIFTQIRHRANIPLQLAAAADDHPDGLHFYITYIGPLGGQGQHKQIKVDISRNEQLVFPPVLKETLAAYSDLRPCTLSCYTLEEVLVEKLRSVMQRAQARDLYDIWYLLEECGLEPRLHLREFEIKCSSKALNYKDFLQKLDDRMPQYKQRWQGSLSSQIQDLPEFSQVERAVRRHLRQLDL